MSSPDDEPLPRLPPTEEMKEIDRAQAEREAARRAQEERAAALEALKTGPRVRGELGTPPASWPSSAESMVVPPTPPSSRLLTPQESALITGPLLLTEADVQSVFEQQRESFERCATIDPTAEGVVRMRFLVSAPGEVLRVDPLGSSVANVDVVKCTINAVQRFKFPAAAGGTGQVFYNIVYGEPRPDRASTEAPARPAARETTGVREPIAAPQFPAAKAPARPPEPVAAPQFPAAPRAEPRRGRSATKRPPPSRR